jgi:hypothetical protein
MNMKEIFFWCCEKEGLGAEAPTVVQYEAIIHLH